MSFRGLLFLAAFLLLNFPTKSNTALAWGERGHDLIARVAARIVTQRTKEDKALSPFLMKEHMLGHLANVPDIYFRGLPSAAKVEAPTHYIDLEYLTANPSLVNLPLDFAKAEALATKNRKDLETEVGTNPWRCAQLFRLMTEALRQAKDKDGLSESQLKEPVLKALTYAGMLSHYVGDLSQPLHATKDYDGWDAKQGGIHSYFEEKVVSALSLSADYEVFATALKEEPFKRLLQNLAEVDRTRIRKDPTGLAFALAIDSFKAIPQVLRLDKSVSLLAPSKSSPIKIPAERRPAGAVADKYRALVIERLAMGADAVAHFWLLAWENAGKPDLSAFRSFDYVLTPEYVVPDYLSQKPAVTPSP